MAMREPPEHSYAASRSHWVCSGNPLRYHPLTARAQSIPSMAAFRCFRSLPTEIRLEIWRLSLPSELEINRPHLCVYRKGCWRIERPPPDDTFHQICQKLHMERLPVDIPVPQLAVCRESRTEALRWAEWSHISWSRAHNSPICCRPFNVERDVLFVPDHACLPFLHEASDQMLDLDVHNSFAKLKTIAFSLRDAADENILKLEDVWMDYDMVRTFLVFANPEDMGDKRSLPCQTEHFITMRLSANEIEESADGAGSFDAHLARDLDRYSRILSVYDGFHGWHTISIGAVTALS